MILQTKYYQLNYKNAAVRWIKSGDTEIIRMIYSAVRDHNWGTIKPVILDEQVVQKDDGFEVITQVEYQQNNIHFKAEYRITGQGKTLAVKMEGEALSTFQTCRVGFCVLHPVKECAGTSCKIIHPDGSIDEAVFPKQIVPYQPMMNIAEMSWQPSRDISARLKFEGDIFEMEDQRNWTDASYKTYCRPLELPFPYEIKKGEKVFQQIILEMDADELSDRTENEPIIFKIDKNKIFKLPELGVCKTSRPEMLKDSEANILKELPFSHIRVELKLFKKEWKSNLERVTAEANKLELTLLPVLYFSENWEKEIVKFENELKKYALKSNHILIVGKNHLPNDVIFKVVKPKLKRLFPEAKIGAGVNAYFTELNRNRPNTGLENFINFTICPQVHAFDNASLVENLEAQKYALKSAQSLFPNKPISISPITLKQRFNVVATSEEPPPPPGVLPTQVDTRQNTIFAAQWLLGSLKFLAQSGAKLVTYFETVGWRGIIQGEFEPPIPEKFSAKPGDVFPIFHVLKELTEFNEVLFSDSNKPLMVDGIVLQNKNELKVLLANFSDNKKEVRLLGMGELTKGRIIFQNRKLEISEKIVLPPFDIVVIKK